MALLFFAISLALYLAATIGFVAHVVLGGRDGPRRWGTIALWIALGADTIGLALRAVTLGNAVLNSFDDQLSLLAWLLVGVYLGLQTRYHLAVLGALVSPLAFLLTLSSYIVFSGAQTLPARLQDAWLPAHIAPAFFGYALFAFASCLSLVYLLQERQLKAKRRHVIRRLPSLETLDDLTYRCVAWGFGLFTIGIVTGSLLAKARLGAFWSWEPVQILSVLAWLLYAVLLQTRSVGWRGRRAATLTIVGFALLIVSFLSLNLGVASHGRALGVMQHEVLIVGLNHRTAEVGVREAVAFADEQLDEVNRRLRGLDGLDEAAVVCTCNRVEVIGCTRTGNDVADRIADFLRIAQSGAVRDLAPHLYNYSGRDAVRHLFRVASSLDSMVVGEPQILGQLKQFYARAASVGATGAILHRWFHKAFSVAKRVRTETAIAGKAVSVSSAAVELASTIFDRLDGKTAMLIGAGKMGQLAARHLLGNGVGALMVTNRTFDRAVELARDFKATPVPFEHFTKYLPMADIIIGSTAAATYVLTDTMVHDALRERKGRPMFCIDLSVPRNFEPRINAIDNVYLYDIDDLAKVTEENRDERGREADKAERIVSEEVESFWRWLGHLEVVPTIVALREKMEGIRRAEVQKTLGAALKELGPREREALDALTEAIVNKILHTPITRLKQRDQRTEAFYIDAARRLFAIDDTDES